MKIIVNLALKNHTYRKPSTSLAEPCGINSCSSFENNPISIRNLSQSISCKPLTPETAMISLAHFIFSFKEKLLYLM